ncbi:MAG: MBL fold metallo-hydrolase [Lachnospiraceae bacterium]|nr:MBL fold metallo-hydrolase [Lachnospiraceae bacterium]
MSVRGKIPFIPLGGGQRVGASCYYLQLAGANIILDAGTGLKEGIEYGPDLYGLATSPFIESLGQIDQIYISHAHADHVAYLMDLAAMAPRASIYMTEPTKVLAEFQLYDRLLNSGKLKEERAQLAVKSLMDRIVVVSYLQSLDFGKYKVTFYPAGHIPGAMMVHFEGAGTSILYTGDFSLEGTSLTPGCVLPNASPEILIMCGLHAKHPDFHKSKMNLQDKADALLEYAYKTRTNVKCCVQQLSKSVEVLKALNDANKYEIPIVLDDSVMNPVRKMEQLRIPILTKHNKLLSNNVERPHIYLSAVRKGTGSGYKEVKMDFSLHEDYDDMKAFIKKLNPKTVAMVHCGAPYKDTDNTIEQELINDGECRAQFIFAEESEINFL